MAAELQGSAGHSRAQRPHAALCRSQREPRPRPGAWGCSYQQGMEKCCVGLLIHLWMKRCVTPRDERPSRSPTALPLLRGC